MRVHVPEAELHGCPVPAIGESGRVDADWVEQLEADDARGRAVGTHAPSVKRKPAREAPTTPRADDNWGDIPEGADPPRHGRLEREARFRSERRRTLIIRVLLAGAGILLLGGGGVAMAMRALGAPHLRTAASTTARPQAQLTAPAPPPAEAPEAAADSAPADTAKSVAIVKPARSSKMVALSFDDGPSRNTAKVVEILRTHEASATFFFVGRRMTKGAFDPSSLRAVGEIGNHTWWHSKDPWNKYAYWQARAEIEDTNSRIRDKSGADAVWFRSVGLKHNREVDRAVKDTGMKFVGGVLVDDWGQGSGNTAAAIKTRVVTLAAKDRSVLILHETNNETVKALPHILDWYQEHGFQVVTVSELMDSE